MKAGSVPYQEGEDDQVYEKPVKKSNTLPIWGNEKTMNLNPLILTNIQSSQYFKVNLYQLKTYHEVIDEIYYQVNHLEPWEKGSRKTSGQTGMCGGVRGVGAGGIVSTAFCILYKLYTLKLTRKQLLGLINHSDSPFIRGLGFMYIRFTQPPADLWDWFEGYFDDDEEIDVRAGGGQPTTIGNLVRHMLTKLDWHATLFPRIPVPIQKDIEKKLADRALQTSQAAYSRGRERDADSQNEYNGEASRDRNNDSSDRRNRSDYFKERDRSKDRDEQFKDRDRDGHFREREYPKERYRNSDHSRLKEHHRQRKDRSRDRGHHSSYSDYSSELQKEKDRIRRQRHRSRSRSRSRDSGYRRRD